VKIRLDAALALLLAALSPAAAGAADVPLPPPPPGTMPLAAGGAARAYKLAVLAGFLAQGETGSPSLQVDLGRVVTPSGWTRAELEWHVPLRVARPHWKGVLTDPSPGTTEDTVWIGEALASGRLLLPVAPGLKLFVEAGVGLALTLEEHVADQTYVGAATDRQLVLAPSAQGAVGLTWALGERLDLVFQPAAFGRRLKADASTFSALWGLSYRL
jgi:hypothetical protein